MPPGWTALATPNHASEYTTEQRKPSAFEHGRAPLLTEMHSKVSEG
jgi:hypothetical protein